MHLPLSVITLKVNGLNIALRGRDEQNRFKGAIRSMEAQGWKVSVQTPQSVRTSQKRL